MPTVTYPILANGNDGHEYDGVFYPDGDTPPKMYAGRYFGPTLWLLCRWAVTIPIGATIVSATWRLYSGADQNGSGVMRVQAHNVDDSPAVSGGQLPSARTLTTAFVDRNFAAAEWASAGWVSFDATAPIAEVLARGGRSATTNVSLVMYGTAGSPGDGYAAFLDYFAGSNPSELVIEYTVAGMNQNTHTMTGGVTGGGSATVATGNAAPPTLTAGPLADNITSSGFRMRGTTDKAATVSLVVVPYGDPAPNNAAFDASTETASASAGVEWTINHVGS